MDKKITPCINIKKQLSLVAIALFAGAAALAQTTRFVKPVAEGTADGSSWENASDDIQLMINNSSAGDAIWVAGGTYIPNRNASTVTVITPNNRDNAFVIKDNVALYGGFQGSEAVLEERDLTLTEFASILSGDFNGDDVVEITEGVLTITNNDENAYHVMIGTATIDNPMDPDTVLDGFTVKGGNANDAAFTSLTVNTAGILRYAGGGLHNRRYCNPTLTNIIFTGNYAIYGGAVYNRSSSNATYTNVSITQNIGQYGAGMTNWIEALPTLENVTISDNRADAGTGIYNYYLSALIVNNSQISNNVATVGSGGGVLNNNSSPVFTNLVLSGNTAILSGGGMYSAGNSSPNITNAVIFSNSAPTGGGIYGSGNCNSIITGAVFAGNSATAGNGGGYYNYQSAPVFSDVDFSDNSATGYGGGLANWTQSAAQVSYAVFSGNTAGNGGAGVFNYDDSDAVFSHVSFTGNQTPGNGGAVNNRKNSDPVFTNCLFSLNQANYGAGMYNFDNAAPLLTNVTIAANTATTHGGGLTSDGSMPTVRNSIIAGNTGSETTGKDVFNYNNAMPAFFYSLVEGTEEGWDYIGTDGGNNAYGDPMFADIEAANFNIVLDSPARNAGNNAYFDPEQTPDLSMDVTDLAGNPRFFEGGPIDMGAFELQETVGLATFSKLAVTCWPNPVVNVLMLSANENITGVAVYNMMGQQVGATWNPNNNTLNMAALQAGSYLVKATVGKTTGSILVVKK